MTMKDLAKLANVSVSTVSKAFSEAEDINKETKNRIFEIAKQTGCYGKFHKGKYHKKIIGVIVPEIVSDYYKIFLNILRCLFCHTRYIQKFFQACLFNLFYRAKNISEGNEHVEFLGL